MTQARRQFDLVVIGGGSAGYAAAHFAERAGARVAIADQGPLGGLCILRGCMPSKILLRSAEAAALMRRAVEFGLAPAPVSADLAAINERKQRLVREFAGYRIQQLRDPRFCLFAAPACFLSPHEVQVGGQVLQAANFIIATGSAAGRYSFPGLAETGYITSDEALDLRAAPESMLVLGGGPVATELAQFFCRTGTQVTLLQRSAHIHSAGDEDLARPVEERLRAEGMEIYTGTRLLRFADRNGMKTACFIHEGAEKTAAARVILQALGRKPNTDGLNLPAAGVETRDGFIRTDAAMRTSQAHIFAAGDVNGAHEVVHSAIEQGEIAAHNALFPARPQRAFDERLRLSVVFTDPAVASVGLTEKECRARGVPYLAASYPFNDHGKAICLGETHGLVKILCQPDNGEIIGAHIVGPHGGELIHELVAVMHYRGTVRDLLRMPHYHPTLAEIWTYPAEELAAKLPVE